jgi:DNA-binding transcriptional regulator YiaG
MARDARKALDFKNLLSGNPPPLANGLSGNTQSLGKLFRAPKGLTGAVDGIEVSACFVHDDHESRACTKKQAKSSWEARKSCAIYLGMNSTLAERLKHIRYETFPRKVKQAELALYLGVSRGAVGNWESSGNIDRDNALKVCELVPGCTMEWLLQGKGSQPPKMAWSQAPALMQKTAPNSGQLDEILQVVEWTYQALGHDEDEAAVLAGFLREIVQAPRSGAAAENPQLALRLRFEDAMHKYYSRYAQEKAD